MWTVALISNSSCKTYHYKDFAEADKEYKTWLKLFKLNNNVKSRTTMVERDENDNINSVKNIITLAHTLETYYMILSKDSED